MAENNNNSLRIQYFGTWSSYKIPFNPQEPISKEEAERRKAFYVATYNSQDQIIVFEKFLDSEINWRDEYEYWPNGKLKQRKMIRADGTIKAQKFDNKGRIEK